jgi:hypothetical protein
MATVNPMLARFAAELNDAYEKVCKEAPDEFFETFGPVSIKLFTCDGLTAEFYEEGIDFYPSEG